MCEIAAAEDVSERYVAQLLPLAFLKPVLLESCLDGTANLTIKGGDLAKGIDLPRDWRKQASQ